jgi:LysM repeat protein
MRPRRPARFLAPMALVAIVLVVVVVVGSSNAGKRAAAPAPTPVHHRHHRFYRVRRGDTLSRVAVRAGIPVTQLEALNPRLDPHALRPGQRIKLRQ